MEKKCRYVVCVMETRKYTTAVESDSPLEWKELEEIAERRRVDGELSLAGVTDVDSFLVEKNEPNT